MPVEVVPENGENQNDKRNDMFSMTVTNESRCREKWLTKVRLPLVLLLDGACFAAWQTSHSRNKGHRLTLAGEFFGLEIEFGHYSRDDTGGETEESSGCDNRLWILHLSGNVAGSTTGDAGGSLSRWSFWSITLSAAEPDEHFCFLPHCEDCLTCPEVRYCSTCL